MKILLVDDDYLALEGLRNMLPWADFNGEPIGMCTDGIEALNLSKRIHPNVVISDIKMPQMDGLELARYYHENMPDVHMILISGRGEFEYAQRAIQYHVVDYILKPITREKIKEITARLVRLNEEMQLQKDGLLRAWGDELQASLLDAFRHNDSKAVRRQLDSDQMRTLLQGPARDTVGVQFLNYLYTYLQELGGHRGRLSEQKSAAMAAYLDAATSEEKRAYLITKFQDTLQSVAEQKGSYTDPIIAAAQQAVQSNFTDPNFNIAQLADQLHISPAYLSTVFKQSTGENVSNYLTQRRIERAKALLADVSVSVAEVCRQSGYEDAHYFAKSFKKHTGLTPSEYRNLCASGKVMG